MPYTREDLERVIDEGGSVMLPGGHLVTQKHQLPDQGALDEHHRRVQARNEEALSRTPELRPEVLFPAGTADVTAAEPQAPAFDLDTANKAELQAEAARRGLSVPSSATKEDLKDALNQPQPGRQVS